MDTFVDSSWYFLRYFDPHNDEAPFDRGSSTTGARSTSTSAASTTRPVHLLYARFFIKVLNDLGLVGFREPFARLFHQGWVQHGRHEDVEVEGQRPRPRRARRRRTAPTPSVSTSSSSARPTRTWSGRRAASRA